MSHPYCPWPSSLVLVRYSILSKKFNTWLCRNLYFEFLTFSISNIDTFLDSMLVLHIVNLRRIKLSSEKHYVRKRNKPSVVLLAGNLGDYWDLFFVSTWKYFKHGGPPNATIHVWQFFDKDTEKGIVTCKICKIQLLSCSVTNSLSQITK